MLTVVLADTVLFCWGSNWGPSALTVQVLQPVVLFRASQLGVTGQPLAIISLVSSVTLITGESQFFLEEFQTLLIIYIFLAVHAWDQSDCSNNIYFSSSACLRPIRLDNSVPLCLVPDPWLHSSWAASVIIPATCPQTGNTPNILSSCPGCLLSPCPTSLYSWSFLDKQLTYLTWCVCLFIILYKNIYVMTIRVADPCHIQ